MNYIKHTLSVYLLLLSSLSALAQYSASLQSQLQNEYGITGGSFIYGPNEATALNAIKWSNWYYVYCPSCTKTVYDNTDPSAPFNDKMRVNTGFDDRVSPWDTRLDISANVNAGDNLLLVFWVKGLQDQKGTYGATQMYADGKKLGFIPFTNEWKQWIIPVKAKDSSLDIRMDLGLLDMSFEIGGFALINYQGNYSQSLPLVGPENSYPGMEANASWRASAQSRIDQYRKANLNLVFRDLEGKPVPNVGVQVRQQSHDFHFGTSEKAQFIRDERIEKDSIAVNFNSFGLESDQLWDNWKSPQNYGVSRTQLCEVMDWADSEDFNFRWHNALWPSKAHQYYPPGLGTVSQNTFKSELRQFVSEFMNYNCNADRIDEIDVVNEPCLNRDLEDRFEEAGAIDVYRDLFDHIKNNWPEAKRYINEYVVTDNGGYYVYAKYRLKEIINSLNPGRVQGIGFQSHMKFPVAPTKVLQLFNEYNNYADEFKVTEFDLVGIPQNLRAQYLEDFMTIAFSHPKMTGFHFWNIQDEFGWNIYNRPIYDNNGQLKDSGTKFKELVYGTWWTDINTTASSSGSFTSKVFKGKHEVIINYPGGSQTLNYDVSNPISQVITLPIIVDGGVDPEPATCDKISNGDFSNGSNAWQVYQSSSASASPVFSNGQLFMNIADGGNRLHHVQLYQRDIELAANTTYLLSYRTKASSPRTMVVELSQAASPHTGIHYETVDVSTSWKQNYLLVSTDYAVANARLVFNMGNDYRDIYLDNVSLQELDCADACDLLANNLLNNANYWSTYLRSGQASGSSSYNNGQFSFYIDNGGTASWHVQFKHSNVSFQAGKPYTISFKARTISPNASRSMLVDVSDASPPHSGYLYESVSLSDRWKTYNIPFNPSSTDLTARLVFNLGGSATDVQIDDVLLIDNACTTNDPAISKQREGIESTAKPNPFDDQIFLLIEEDLAEPATIKLHDVLGRLVYEDKTTERNLRIPTSQLSSGVYLISIETESRIQCHKVIKE